MLPMSDMLRAVMLVVAILAVVSLALAARGAPSSVLRLWHSFGQLAMVLSLLPWAVMVCLSPMMFGGGPSTRVYIGFGLLLAYLPMVLACLGLSWWFWRQQKEGVAVVFSVVVPALYVVLVSYGS